jgi:hypothetical protein
MRSNMDKNGIMGMGPIRSIEIPAGNSVSLEPKHYVSYYRIKEALFTANGG